MQLQGLIQTSLENLEPYSEVQMQDSEVHLQETQVKDNYIKCGTKVILAEEEIVIRDRRVISDERGM